MLLISSCSCEMTDLSDSKISRVNKNWGFQAASSWCVAGWNPPAPPGAVFPRQRTQRWYWYINTEFILWTSSNPCSSRVTQSWLPGPCLDGFWIYPRIETAQPLWAACFSVWPPSQWKKEIFLWPPPGQSSWSSVASSRAPRARGRHGSLLKVLTGQLSFQCTRWNGLPSTSPSLSLLQHLRLLVCLLCVVSSFPARSVLACLFVFQSIRTKFLGWNPRAPHVATCADFNPDFWPKEERGAAGPGSYDQGLSAPMAMTTSRPVFWTLTTEGLLPALEGAAQNPEQPSDDISDALSS